MANGKVNFPAWLYTSLTSLREATKRLSTIGSIFQISQECVIFGFGIASRSNASTTSTKYECILVFPRFKKKVWQCAKALVTESACVTIYRLSTYLATYSYVERNTSIIIIVENVVLKYCHLLHFDVRCNYFLSLMLFTKYLRTYWLFGYQLYLLLHNSQFIFSLRLSLVYNTSVYTVVVY